MIEGTQGFGLSLYHTNQWPFCTSRDTTAGSFLGEVGLGPRDVEVVLAVRTFPIRVGGNSGPLPNELTWADVQRRSGYSHSVSEYTTTTKRLRRVAAFDWEVVLRSVVANTPSFIALHGADYINFENKGVKNYDELTPTTHDFVRELERRTGTPVKLVGTGPLLGELVDLRNRRVQSDTSQWVAVSATR